MHRKPQREALLAAIFAQGNAFISVSLIIDQSTKFPNVSYKMSGSTGLLKCAFSPA